MRARNHRLGIVIVITLILLGGLVPVVDADYLSLWSGTVPVLVVLVSAYPAFVAAQSCVARTRAV